MAGRGFADIVFCIDASASMAPCFNGVVSNINTFLKKLNSNQQMRWDWRLDFLAYYSTYSGGNVFHHESLHYPDCMVLNNALYHASPAHGQFFTTDVHEFSSALSRVVVQGDEMPLVALDTALDFPWRSSQECHRIVIMLTDEPFETAMDPKFMSSHVDKLVDKLHKLKVMLYLVAPESKVFEKLASADKCEYEVVEDSNNGLRNVDFSEVLGAIGQSISVSTMQSRPQAAPRGLFGQKEWGATYVSEFRGA